MSKLQKMIDELCPNGVEYKKLEDVMTFRNGKGHEKSIVENGKYIVVNSKFISTNGAVKKFTNEQIAPLYKDDILMVMSDLPNGRALARTFLVESDDLYSLNQRICALSVKDKNMLSVDFVNVWLNRNGQLLAYDNGIDQTNLRKSDILEIKVPILPMVVQLEIVRILNSYNRCVTELIEQLKKESDDRQRQYMYYTSELIDKIESGRTVELEEVCGVYDGTHSTPQYTDSGIRFVSVENINDLYNSPKYISEEAYSKFKIKPQVGDVFMTRIGTMGKCAIVDREEPLGYYVSLALLRPDKSILSSEYLRWYLESGSGWKELEARTLWNATPIKINKGEIGKMLIKIPSLEIQKKVVSKISAYYEAKTDILNKLSLEIEARQKQYEFYRDKLLTFEEAK
ncbi:MAG: restriction endonuclease subunit S [Butyrivibrio crossotus]|nr:restriction endonuclease subunit S [Butyrivibrio crossotus]